ncbi:MAG TPA: HD domain-containing phosphohydrolase, partial [Spirochaetota bacterium]|nr:HD domain-containing phosphohydrolase [Spirochaetota bacterium]
MSIKLLKENGDLYPEITKEFCKRIKKVASMHDVGKIGIPDYILTKPGKLTEEEFKIMQEHTINGAFILSELAGQMARDIALFHHEKWNGLGYPYGFKEDQIPLSARIVAIADVYDALRMKRSYKESIPHEKTIKMVIEGKGSHFDPTLIDKFLEMDKEFNEIFEKMNDER